MAPNGENPLKKKSYLSRCALISMIVGICVVALVILLLRIYCPCYLSGSSHKMIDTTFSFNNCYESCDIPKAQLFYQAYNNKYAAFRAKMTGDISYKAYSISKCHFGAMREILSRIENAQAFRFYRGIDPANGSNVLIICGVTADDDDIEDYILICNELVFGLCPRYCDENSLLVTQGCGELGLFRYFQPVEVEKACAAILHYSEENGVNEGVVDGFTISREQYFIMLAIANEYRDYAGFRIYFGLDMESTEVRFICAFDNENRDVLYSNEALRTSIVYVTPSKFSGICPRYCDDNSFIFNNIQE
jgi:hypothetical protein